MTNLAFYTEILCFFSPLGTEYEDAVLRDIE